MLIHLSEVGEGFMGVSLLFDEVQRMHVSLSGRKKGGSSSKQSHASQSLEGLGVPGTSEAFVVVGAEGVWGETGP